MSTLTAHSYGKSQVRLVKVVRRGDRHDLKDLAVGVRFEGDFEAAYVAGDNRRVLPTDTMKNTVYAIARKCVFDDIEEFGLALSRFFIAENPQASRVRIEIAQRLWSRLAIGGKAQGHAFVQNGDETRTCVITSNGERVAVIAGLDNLLVLKTKGSGFEGFLRDELTTLKPTTDRILATVVTARWTYLKPEVTWGPYWLGVRQTLVDTFVQHESRSVQHTLFAMADAVLSSYEEIGEITITLPNKHHLPIDLSAFGLDNPNELFVPTDEPYGLIEGTVTRG